jgi:FdhD protein
MAALTVRRQIHRYTAGGEFTELEDELIDEYRLNIRVDGQEFIQAVVFPTLIEEFVLGFLMTRGLIDDLGDLSSLKIRNDEALVERHPRLRGKMPQLSFLESTGSRNINIDRIEPVGPRGSGAGLSLPAKVLVDGMRLLSEMPLYNRTGGTHCAILFSSAGDPLVSAEDIGRHNSVDKVIGGGLKKGADFTDCWLAVSGRLPADMVCKAVLMGVPLIASVSAPTSNGARMGERAGVSVIGFAREGRFNCYSHPERIRI